MDTWVHSNDKVVSQLRPVIHQFMHQFHRVHELKATILLQTWNHLNFSQYIKIQQIITIFHSWVSTTVVTYWKVCVKWSLMGQPWIPQKWNQLVHSIGEMHWYLHNACNMITSEGQNVCESAQLHLLTIFRYWHSIELVFN